MKPFLSLFLAISSLLFVSCDKETILAESNLPQEISKYLQTHFPTHPVIQIVKDQDGLGLTYDIYLQGGYYLEFSRKREVIDIEGNDALPSSVIPARIQDYVTQNYPAQFITGWELENRHQQIKLNLGLELEFTMDGDFLRIDP